MLFHRGASPRRSRRPPARGLRGCGVLHVRRAPIGRLSYTYMTIGPMLAAGVLLHGRRHVGDPPSGRRAYRAYDFAPCRAAGDLYPHGLGGRLLRGVVVCLAAVFAVAAGVVCAVPGALASHEDVPIQGPVPDPDYPPDTCSIAVDDFGRGGPVTAWPYASGAVFGEPTMTVVNNGSLNAMVAISVGDWFVDPPAGPYDWRDIPSLPYDLTLVALDYSTCVWHTDAGINHTVTFRDCHWYYPGYHDYGSLTFGLKPGGEREILFDTSYNFSVLHADRLVQEVTYHASCGRPANIMPNGTVLNPHHPNDRIYNSEYLESLVYAYLAVYPQGNVSGPPMAPDDSAGHATLPITPGNMTGPPVAGVPIVVELGRADRAVPINVTAVGLAASMTIDVGGLAGSVLDGTSTSIVTFPSSETIVATSFVTVSFPPGVTAAHVPADGLLDLRVSTSVPDGGKVQGALGYEGSGRVTLQRVVEVGSGAGRVTFDMPVRIFLEGQAGGRAFYIGGGAGGAIMPIDEACAADDVDRVHVQLGGAGECHVDSAGGGKVIYTYHLTRFGTALPEHAAPLPTIYTCAVDVGTADLDMRATPGGYSEPVRQEISNRGTLSFERVDLMATPWHVENGGGSRAGAEPLLLAAPPAGVTEVLDMDAGGGVDGYASVVERTAVARGLGGGDIAPLLFRLNLTAYGGLQGGAMAQNVTYQATCGPP